MNSPDVIAVVDRLLRETVHGSAGYNPALLLVVRALLMHVDQPARIWRIYAVAHEDASNSGAIDRIRKELPNGKLIATESSVDVTKDSWVCYVALEAEGKQGRTVAVEILEPYRFDDPGCVLDLSVLRAMPNLAESKLEHWTVDLENLAGTRP